MPMLDPDARVRFVELTVEGYARAIAADSVSVRGPVGFFPLAEPEHQYRLLATEGDGLGGVSLDMTRYPELVQRLNDADAAGQSLWLAIDGEVEQYLTTGMLNREAEPDAMFTTSEVMGFYETARHQFQPVIDP